MIDELHFLMIVDDRDIASFVSENGVDTLFVDLEWKGKETRQPGAHSWKSKQTLEDVSRIREAAPSAELLVRLNPLDDDTPFEIDNAIARGADCLMLPMFSRADEILRFADLVSGRASVVPLFETMGSLLALPQIIGEMPIERAHIGLNDLHLDLGMRFMFQPLTEGFLEEPCAILRENDVVFGIGGLARFGEGILDPSLLVGEHVRLGSTWAILSRTFHRQAKSLCELISSTEFKSEVDELRGLYNRFRDGDPEELERNRLRAADRVSDVLHLMARE